MAKSYLMQEKDGKLMYTSALILENPSSISLIDHPIRIKILELLNKEPMYPAELAKHLNLHEQKVYYHIKQLVNAGVLHIVEKKDIRGTTAKKFAPKNMSFGVSLSKDWKKANTLIEKKDETITKFLEGFVSDGKLNSYFVVGSPDPHGPHKARARDGHYAIDLAMFFGQNAEVSDDFSVKLDVDIDMKTSGNLIIVGGPVTNLLCSKLNDFLPAKFSDQKPWGIITNKDTYTDDAVGMIARIQNPYNPEYKILIIAGIRFTGTKSAVMALTRHTKQVLARFSGQKEFYCIVHGFDLDGDGRLDSIEVLE